MSNQQAAPSTPWPMHTEAPCSAATDQGAPVDWVEGEGLGATLAPASLWERQRALRCAREQRACDP